ncbi:MAG TPA: YceI family protein [Kiritimatiellia bacterium]|nr:YceI family protein [Kiritimatiellia bacterium]
MKKQRFILMILFAASITMAGAAPEPRITFSGDSTLHAFEGHGHADSFEHRRGTNGAHVFAMTVSARSLETGLGARDAKMWKLLDVDHFPTLSGRLEAIPDAWLASADDAGIQSRPLQLSLRDHEEAVPAQIQCVREDDGTGWMDVSFTVSLKAFGLSPPSVLGLIRVRDTVDVKVRLPLDDQEESGS